MLSLIIAESSIELVPKELIHHPSVVASAKKFEKNPSEILLDNSWHFAAMKGIKNENKRGRPDLVHFSLLEATSIPLFFEKKIQIFVHTIDDNVITIGNDVRLPKSFHRFVGLIEKLFREKIIQANDNTLLKLEQMDIQSLIEMIKPSKIVGLSTQGQSSTYGEVASNLDENTCLIIGGFQKGHFDDSTQKIIDKLFRVENRSLESHVILSRILYEYEKTIFM
ncbi:MAG: ribosome biogenesis protein [Nitrosopumilaceae archaeon]|nr:ribosome biogenesis protein [Nitrosopumilaceae archaeon]